MIKNQLVDFHKFKTDHNASFVSKLGRDFTWHVKIGAVYQWQKMQSDLFLNQTTNSSDQNNLQWRIFNPYFKNYFEYNKNKWKFTLDLPLEEQFYTNEAIAKDKTYRSFFINPDLFIKYKTNIDLEFTINSSINSKYTNLNEVYENYILSSYNNMHKNDFGLNLNRSWQSSFRIKYKNLVNAIFADLMFLYSWQQNSQLMNYEYANDGSAILSAIEKTNRQHKYHINARFSKYESALKSTLGFTTDLNFLKSERLYNAHFTNYENTNVSLQTNIKSNPLSWLRLNYATNFNYFSGKIQNQAERWRHNISHKIEAWFVPIENHSLKLNFDYYTTKSTAVNQMQFLDLMYRFSMTKYKIDFEVTATNLFNEKHYFQNNQSDNYENIYIYKLRPTQVMALVRFTF